MNLGSFKRELVAKTSNFLSTAFDFSKKPAYSIKHKLSRASKAYSNNTAMFSWR